MEDIKDWQVMWSGGIGKKKTLKDLITSKANKTVIFAWIYIFGSFGIL